MTTIPLPSFSILTLNLRFGLADDGPHAWIHRRAVLRQLLEAHACDLMTFQEANDFQIDFLAECLPQYDSIGQRQPAPRFWQNNVIFFRAPWKLDTWDHFYLSPTPDIPSRYPASHWPRQCTLARFTNGPAKLICGTTHLDFDDNVQVASAQIILKRINRIAMDCPVVLTGDFNCTPSSSCHAVFTGPVNDNKQSLTPFRNVLKPPYPGTFHGFQGGRSNRCIDWILYRGAITTHRAHVLAFQIDALYPSDHYPVTADFRGES